MAAFQALKQDPVRRCKQLHDCQLAANEEMLSDSAPPGESTAERHRQHSRPLLSEAPWWIFSIFDQWKMESRMTKNNRNIVDRFRGENHSWILIMERKKGPLIYCRRPGTTFGGWTWAGFPLSWKEEVGGVIPPHNFWGASTSLWLGPWICPNTCGHRGPGGSSRSWPLISEKTLLPPGHDSGRERRTGVQGPPAGSLGTTKRIWALVNFGCRDAEIREDSESSKRTNINDKICTNLWGAIGEVSKNIINIPCLIFWESGVFFKLCSSFKSGLKKGLNLQHLFVSTQTRLDLCLIEKIYIQVVSWPVL